jgi:hypothetical protein
MSISALAQAAFARRADMNPPALLPDSAYPPAANDAPAPSGAPLDPPPFVPAFSKYAAAAASMPDLVKHPSTLPAAPRLAVVPDEKSTKVTLDLLFGYIPSEVLTLYVAVLAATQQNATRTRGAWFAFWAFLVATPFVIWLIYAAECKAKQKPLPLRLRAWPVWEMTAGTIAYCAWAFALPNAPFNGYGWYSSALAGVAVLVTSTLLSLLAPLFRRPLHA